MMTLTFFPLLLAACFCDIRKRVIPNWIVLLGVGIGIAINGLDGIIGALVGMACLVTASMLGYALYDKVLLGGGDVKLLAMVGAFFGVKVALVTFALSPVLGLAFWLVASQPLAYAPPIAMASLLALRLEGVL